MTKRAALKVFRDECLRLADLWSITDWEVRVVDGEPNSDALAQCGTRYVKRIATLRLNGKPTKPDPVLSTKWVRGLARHEMVHVLLGEMTGIGCSRFVSSDEAEAAEEALVQRLLRLLP